ncbi:MAG: transcriptional regulator [Moorellaceae bacterium]
MSALPTHIRRFCKDILRQYPLMKKELAALEEERRAIAGAVPVATWREEIRVKAVGDRTATQAFRLLRLEERWRQVHFYVQAVEDLLSCLDEEKRKLVKLYFFDGYPPWRVAGEIGISERTFSDYLRGVLLLLAHRLGL